MKLLLLYRAVTLGKAALLVAVIESFSCVLFSLMMPETKRWMLEELFGKYTRWRSAAREIEMKGTATRPRQPWGADSEASPLMMICTIHHALQVKPHCLPLPRCVAIPLHLHLPRCGSPLSVFTEQLLWRPLLRLTDRTSMGTGRGRTRSRTHSWSLHSGAAGRGSHPRSPAGGRGTRSIPSESFPPISFGTGTSWPTLALMEGDFKDWERRFLLLGLSKKWKTVTTLSYPFFSQAETVSSWAYGEERRHRRVTRTIPSDSHRINLHRQRGIHVKERGEREGHPHRQKKGKLWNVLENSSLNL